MGCHERAVTPPAPGVLGGGGRALYGGGKNASLGLAASSLSRRTNRTFFDIETDTFGLRFAFRVPLVPSSCSAGSRVSAPTACSRWPSSGLSSAVSRRSGDALSARVRGQNLRGKYRSASSAVRETKDDKVASRRRCVNHGVSVDPFPRRKRTLSRPTYPPPPPLPLPPMNRSLSRSPRPPRPCARIATFVATSDGWMYRRSQVALASRQRDELVFEGYVWRDVYRVPNLREATSPHSGGRRPRPRRAMPAPNLSDAGDCFLLTRRISGTGDPACVKTRVPKLFFADRSRRRRKLAHGGGAADPAGPEGRGGSCDVRMGIR